MTRYRWVDSRRAEGFLVTLACAVAGVSTRAIDAWLDVLRHAPTLAQMEQAYLINAIIDVHRESDGAYGVPRVARQLRHDGWPVNHKRVERLMRANGIVGVHKRRGVRTTIPAQDNPPIPDLIGRAFAPDARISHGAAISPTSAPARVGSTSPRSWTWARVGCSATRWPATCAPSWSPTPWTWLSRPATATSQA